jgi:hypothetical protein
MRGHCSRMAFPFRQRAFARSVRYDAKVMSCFREFSKCQRQLHAKNTGFTVSD